MNAKSEAGEKMDRSELVQYWVETANQDYNTMMHLFESEDYAWCLFVGHIVIEKLLKALYVKNIDLNPPKIHDLLRLAEKTLIPISEEQEDLFDLITTFNISARYPDYKRTFYKKCDCKFTAISIGKIKELREWLLIVIENQ